jgi:hypothetical protein
MPRAHAKLARMTQTTRRFPPLHRDWLERFEIVADVTSAIHCANFIVAGQSFVFDLNGILDATKSSAKLCLGILARIQPALLMAQDRAAEGLHPISPRWRNFDCYDTGIDHGGMGKVTVRLYLRDARTGATVEDATTYR